MIIRLADATPENAGTKAAVLGRLLRAGFPVPPGFVIPINAHRTATTHLDPPKALTIDNPDETRQLVEGHAVPAGLVEGLAVPAGLVEGLAVRAGLVEEQFVPAGLVEGQAVPAGLAEEQAVPAGLVEELRGVVEGLGDGPLAVRSSAVGEDSAVASAAGQYDSYLGIRGVPAVADKVRAIWESLWSRRAVAYRQAFGQEPGQPDEAAPGIAVIVQRQVHADVAGVLFTADRRTADNSTSTGTAGTLAAAGTPAAASTPDSAGTPGSAGTPAAGTPAAARALVAAGTLGAGAVLEASWGLGESVVQGLVTPDAYTLSTSDQLTRQLGSKATRRDAGPAGGVVVSEVALGERERFCLEERLVRRVMELGRAVAAELGGPQDIEFAVEGDRVWILQARPITAPLAVVDPVEEPRLRPPDLRHDREEPGVLRGVGGSPGVATGPARVVEGVGDFGRVEQGDVLVCRFTDPAWTPLFGVVAGVVTEVGGRLSHAAIVAREHRIPAVLGVAGVMSAVEDGQVITIVGNTGVVSAPGLLQP